jgi:hypothetical protein
MAATDRFGLRSWRNSRKSAHAWSHNAKTQVKPRAIRLHRFGPQGRVNSYDISSSVETIIVRRLYASARLRTLNGRGPYHYSSINPQRRNSENCWSFCGNPATSNSADFRTPLINKHLDLFQNGPPLAIYGATRPSTYVLVSRN